MAHEEGSDAADAALFLAKYSSARAKFLATEGLTHFFRPGKTVREQPAASSFSFAATEKARAFTFNLTLSSPSPKIWKCGNNQTVHNSSRKLTRRQAPLVAALKIGK